MANTAPPTSLTLNGIKKLCESTNLAAEFQSVPITLQVVEVTIFGAENAKKNIKGKVCISDGVSKMIDELVKIVWLKNVVNGNYKPLI